MGDSHKRQGSKLGKVSVGKDEDRILANFHLQSIVSDGFAIWVFDTVVLQETFLNSEYITSDFSRMHWSCIPAAAESKSDWKIQPSQLWQLFREIAAELLIIQSFIFQAIEGKNKRGKVQLRPKTDVKKSEARQTAVKHEFKHYIRPIIG